MSLGRAKGAVVLGQPLDLLIDVRLDSADDAVGQCFDAEVFHADSRVDGNRVQVTVQNLSSSLDAVVRVRSSAIIDEPVLGVVLRSTCGQKTSRRYDFLTDFPVEVRAGAVPTVIPSTVTAANSAVAPPSSSSTASTGASVSPLAEPSAVVAPPVMARSRAARAPAPSTRSEATSRPVVARPVKAREQPSRPAVAPVNKAEAVDSKPRLRLDAPQTPDERLVQLKPSAELLSTPTDNAQQRAEAAAAWRTLNQLPPAENPQDKQRLQALEGEAKALKLQLAKNEEDFRLRLERLEANRYDGNVVYALLGLLAAALAAAAFWWNRSRKSEAMAADWSRQRDPAEALPAHSEAPVSLSPVDVVAPVAAGVATPRAAVAKQPEIADPDIDESLFQDLKKLTTVTLPQKLSAAAATQPGVVAAAPARGISPDDFFDVQQHADFFVSLGQYDQAIDVLKKNIDENIEVSPLAYLELLKIYHTLSRQDDYNHLRSDFNRIFNGNVPAFAAFSDEGHGLEDYPSALLTIEKNWGTPQVLDIIESSLYRTPGDSTNRPFDLAAYRDFLLLHAIAKSGVRRTAGASGVAESLQVGRSAPPPVKTPPSASFEASMASMLDEPMPPEPAGDGSHTQPMLLMPDSSKNEPPSSSPEAGTPSYRQPLDLDLDLDLNLDFSNSELLAMRSADVGGEDSELPMLDLPPTATVPVAVPGFPPADPLDSNLIEFDLFDPSIEAKISPKAK